jgi:predicted DNA-binding transcriptional regulator AlpA
MKSEIQPRLLSIKQAAIYCGMAEQTLRNRISRRAENPFPVRPKKNGRRVLFDRRELDDFIDNLPTIST